jgi:hypothetical protein
MTVIPLRTSPQQILDLSPERRVARTGRFQIGVSQRSFRQLERFGEDIFEGLRRHETCTMK